MLSCSAFDNDMACGGGVCFETGLSLASDLTLSFGFWQGREGGLARQLPLLGRQAPPQVAGQITKRHKIAEVHRSQNSKEGNFDFRGDFGSHKGKDVNSIYILGLKLLQNQNF